MNEDKRSSNDSGELDEERIRRKAYELWIAEGQPSGRDREHWALARELIAIEDSEATTTAAPAQHWRTSRAGRSIRESG